MGVPVKYIEGLRTNDLGTVGMPMTVGCRPVTIDGHLVDIIPLDLQGMTGVGHAEDIMMIERDLIAIDAIIAGGIKNLDVLQMRGIVMGEVFAIGADVNGIGATAHIENAVIGGEVLVEKQRLIAHAPMP